MEFKVDLAAGPEGCTTTVKVFNIEAKNSDEAIRIGWQRAKNYPSVRSVWVQEIPQAKYFEYRCGIKSQIKKGSIIAIQEKWIHCITTGSSDEKRVANYIRCNYINKVIDNVEYGNIEDAPFLFRTHNERPTDNEVIFINC